jgi:regulatory protein
MALVDRPSAVLSPQGFADLNVAMDSPRLNAFRAAAMGKITALVAQKKNKDRVNVFIDEEFAFGLALIEAAKLKRGQELSPDEIARLKTLDEIEMAHERALNFLSFRPRSAEEVRRNLRAKGCPEVTIAAVLQRLEDSGLVDDSAFASYWVENREQFNPLSLRALSFELRQKGVSAETIEAALQGVDETESAYRAAQPRARRLARLDKAAFRKRLGEFLTRRGFAYRVAREVADRLWGERETDSETPIRDDQEPESFMED